MNSKVVTWSQEELRRVDISLGTLSTRLSSSWDHVRFLECTPDKIVRRMNYKYLRGRCQRGSCHVCCRATDNGPRGKQGQQIVNRATICLLKEPSNHEVSDPGHASHLYMCTRAWSDGVPKFQRISMGCHGCLMI